MSLGTNIKKYRLKMNLSQQDLADKMGYKSRSTIAKIESEENDITQSKIKKFAQVLNVTVEDLTGIWVYDDFGFQSIKKDENTIYPHKNRNIAVVLAGGKTIGNNQNIPNQFVDISGKPSVVCVLSEYQKHPLIDEIYLVCLKSWESIVSVYAEQYGISKLKAIIPGGRTGIQSIKNAVDYINQNGCNKDDIIIFQESTRPLISFNDITKVLQACIRDDSAILCKSTRGSVQFYLDGEKPRYIDRNKLVEMQSPEAHKFFILEEVFEKAKKTAINLSESCFSLLLYRLNKEVNFIEGGKNNIKIVSQEDIEIATALLKYYNYK